MTRVIIALVLALVLVLEPLRSGDALAADAPASSPAAASSAPAPPIVRETTIGPVKATVTVSPGRARLGDPFSLELRVAAAPGVDVRMPAFGEALGRFTIADYAPRQEAAEGGGTLAIQRYTLEAPMSGKQTIPALLVEFTDRRPGAAAGEAGDHELLTEEVAVEVEPVSADGATLRPARGALDETWPPPMPASRKAGIIAAIALAAGAFLARRAYVAARARRARRTAFDIAAARLRALEARGMPAAGGVDAWYVELSSIVRRYIEDRYGVRAPELTTEEFIRDVQHSEALASEHAKTLRAFLERCDVVKFSAYRPAEVESREALAVARRFLEETREGAPLVHVEGRAA